MTPKEKAQELVDNFSAYVEKETINGYSPQTELENAKECALIAVNLHLTELGKMKLIFSDRELHYKYWQEVKQEIEKL